MMSRVHHENLVKVSAIVTDFCEDIYVWLCMLLFVLCTCV